MSNILKSDDFGLKIYNRFPLKYREDDITQNFALKRYIQSASDGGFAHIINDSNGILNLVDPSNIDGNLLHIMYNQYGLELFNGIPENYLRYLLPRMSEAWSRKGSLSVVDFITSTLSGVKSVTETGHDDKGNPFVTVKLEMDYSMDSEYFPEVDQLNKLLENFIPFYCDLNIYYTYLFYENQSLKMGDIDEVLPTIINEESTRFNLIKRDENDIPPAIFDIAVSGISIFGYVGEYVDEFNDNIVEVLHEEGSFSSSLETSYSVIKTLDGSETYLDY